MYNHKRICLKQNFYSVWLIVFVAVCCISCAKKMDTGEDEHVTSMCSVEITARLSEIRGEFPNIKLYDYAYVLKYHVEKVHRGTVDSGTIYVGHYNPLKPRATVADARSGDIGGNVKIFRTGDVHRMALEVPIDDYFMGGIINKYIEEETGPVYWAVWTNRVVQ